MRERACIPQFDGSSQCPRPPLPAQPARALTSRVCAASRCCRLITCLADGYIELDNCRGSCAPAACLNVCGGPCDASNGTCASMADTSSSRTLNFFERSQCVTNVTLADMPAAATAEFKISNQFDAVGSVEAVAFQAAASGAEGGTPKAWGGALAAALGWGLFWFL